MSNETRRDFIQKSALVTIGLTSATSKAAMNMEQGQTGSVPMRRLGKSDIQVSALSIGGYHLGSAETQDDANEIVAHALDAGINFFDNAWEYHDGKSESWMGTALGKRRKEAVLMTKVCTHGRDKTVAMQMLEESLRRLQTDYLDVWQIHEVVYDNDPDMIFGPNGAAEALLKAKQDGKVRLIGFTGHKNPAIHLKVLSHGFPFDTVQMPLNAFDATFRSFEQHVLPEAMRQGIAVLGMKSMGGSGEMVKEGGITPEKALRYAMSLPVATTISGINSLEILKQNLMVAADFKPMTPAEMAKIRSECRGDAADGRFELFKTTTMYDGPIGRQQHGFPPVSELPA